MGKLSYELSDISNLDEALQGMYDEVTQDGKKVYRLSVDGAVSIAERDKIYGALKSERELKSNLEKSLKAFGDITPEKVQELTEKVVGLEAASGKPNEEFIQKMEEIKTSYQNKNVELKNDYERQLKQLTDELNLNKNMLSTIRRDEALKSVYNDTGDPSMFSAFRDHVSPMIEFDDNKKEWRSTDGLLNLKEVVESVFSKCPGFLKATISAGAKETGASSGSWDAVFDPKSPAYSKDKQVALFREDPDKARTLLAKYRR